MEFANKCRHGLIVDKTHDFLYHLDTYVIIYYKDL